MFNFANHLKLWIKLPIQIKQTKMVTERTSSKERNWDLKSKGHKLWKYSMFLLPNVLKSQNVGSKDHIGDTIKF